MSKNIPGSISSRVALAADIYIQLAPWSSNADSKVAAKLAIRHADAFYEMLEEVYEMKESAK